MNLCQRLPIYLSPMPPTTVRHVTRMQAVQLGPRTIRATNGPIQPHLQHLAAASSAATSLEANLKHSSVTLATWDAVWEVYWDPKWARQRLRLYGAQDWALEQFFKQLEKDMAEVLMERHGRAKQLVDFFGAASIGTGGGWGADAVLWACCKVVCRPRGSDQWRGRVTLVDEHRTTRVSSAVNGQQPCEEELDHEQPTRRAGWKPPAGQVDLRLLRPAWSQHRACSSQEATPAAASDPGPSTPPPAKRSKRTKAEQAAEPTQPTKMTGNAQGKASTAKPAPQPSRWLDRDCNAALNMQRIGDSKWCPLELCWLPDQGALLATGKEYPGLGNKRLRDQPSKAQQQQQQQPTLHYSPSGQAIVMADIASLRDRPAQVIPNATVQDFLERYEVGETVGVGGFAVVKKGKDKRTGEPVAIKVGRSGSAADDGSLQAPAHPPVQVVDKSRYAAGDNSLEREIQVLLKVDHPNCIRLFDVYITPRKVYIVTELVTGGELLDRVTEKGNYSERDAAQLIRQILRGVSYLHAQGIVHRDLKLENMIMSDERDDADVKIADFGLSKFFSPETVLSTMCGSPQYVAPEVLGVGDGLKEYSPAVDMWSVGVILFILLSGYSPFDDDNDAVLFEKIKKGNYDADDPIWENISAEAKDIVAKLLTVDTKKRLTADQALQHPWVQGKVPSSAGLKAVGVGASDKLKAMVAKRDTLRQMTAAAGAATGGQAAEDNGYDPSSYLYVSYALCKHPSLLWSHRSVSFPSRETTTGAPEWLGNEETPSKGPTPPCVSPHCLCPRLVSWPVKVACQNVNCAWLQVIKVPGGAVLRGCKKTKRKLIVHFQHRAEVHSQLRVIASLFALPHPLRPAATQTVSAARDQETGQLVADQLDRWKLLKGQWKHTIGLNNSRRDILRWLAPIKPHLQHLEAASAAGTSLEANLKHISVTLATWDAVWEVYWDPKWARQRLRLYGAQDRALQQFFKKRIGDSKWCPLELCYWPNKGALPAKDKEYPGLGYKRLLDKPPKAQQQQQQQPAEAHEGTDCLQDTEAMDKQVERLVELRREQQRAPQASEPTNLVQGAIEEAQLITWPTAKKAEQAAEPTQPTKAEQAAKPKSKAAKAKPAPQPGRVAGQGLQCSNEHAAHWGEQVASTGAVLLANLGYKRLRDKPLKAQQQQQPAEAQLRLLQAVGSVYGFVQLRHLHGATSKRTKVESAAEPTQPTKGTGKAQGKAAKAKPAPQPGRVAGQGLQCSNEHAAHWGEQVAPAGAVLLARPGSSASQERLLDKPPKAKQQQQQQQQQPAEAQ
ncbi:hypothetical protein QJQ45_023967 [Haematococcus lacustris]|nr:hypothetical protein QJQ45_023967 [Haematococcus lacustris]